MQTHSKYRLIYNGGAEVGVSCDADLGPRTLDEAASKAARINRLSRLVDAGLVYTIEPIPGTEPRYMLHLHWHADKQPMPRPSTWHVAPVPVPAGPLTYLEARSLFERWMARSGHHDLARLVLVQA